MTRSLWTAAQAVSVLVAVALVGLLVVAPAPALTIVWDLLIPVVPLLLLLAPGVWRNLCPVSVVSQLPLVGRMGSNGRLSPEAQRRAPVIAIGLLAVIVPLRHVVFNESGPALAALTLGVLAVAAGGAFAMPGKSGWCATFCPVLPVERLYGQSAWIEAPHAHCSTCTACIQACHDLGPGRTLERLTTPEREVGGARERVLATPMGAFAAAFPGFVLGYYTVPETLAAYLVHPWVLGFAVASAALVAVAQRVSGVGTRGVVRWTAALAGGLYYWFAVPVMAGGISELAGAAPLPGSAGPIVAARAVLLGVIGAWLLVATRRDAGTGRAIHA
ncbi:MAG: hypothetical protein RQ745_09630 [Longimicrobiales bacterium]|nr:hypothetical protein [Longimicrobiales bacterium]